MPIRIPDGLPAKNVLLREGIQVMDESIAVRQDIRPLQIGLLNLMPNKIITESQIARLIGASPLQVDMTLVRIGSHQAKNTSEEHLLNFYNTWDEVRYRKFDGFIITGAPIETMPFEDVSYWKEMEDILDWTTTHVHSSFFVCWGAMAAAWHFHRVPKHDLPEKAFGIFRHKNLAPANPYLSGFSDDFQVSVSRWTEVRREDLTPDFDVLMESPETGLCLLHERFANRLYIFNHIEYDSVTLADEYFRDIAAGKAISVPKNYFPDDDPKQKPLNRWRSHAFLLFGNWITQVYQTTPFNLVEIGHSNATSSQLKEAR